MSDTGAVMTSWPPGCSPANSVKDASLHRGLPIQAHNTFAGYMLLVDDLSTRSTCATAVVNCIVSSVQHI